MLVKVLRDTPYLGQKDLVREVPDGEAKVHIQLGNAEKTTAPEPRKRKNYRRRDMRAESPHAEPKKPKAEEKPKADSEPKPAEETKPETPDTGAEKKTEQ